MGWHPSERGVAMKHIAETPDPENHAGRQSERVGRRNIELGEPNLVKRIRCTRSTREGNKHAGARGDVPREFPS